MPPRATGWEIVGAWLRVWTPPRDVEVPAPPWRKLAAGAVALLVGGAGAYALIAPAVDSGKRRGAALEARAAAASRRAEIARLRRDQRAHLARAERAARLRAAGTSEAEVRAALLADVAASIGADARSRVRSGELDGPIRSGPARCRPLPRPPSGRAQWECLAVTSAIRRPGTARVAGYIGYEFLVSASLRDLRYAWCKTNPRPGEGAARLTLAVPLPRACLR